MRPRRCWVDASGRGGRCLCNSCTPASSTPPRAPATWCGRPRRAAAAAPAAGQSGPPSPATGAVRASSLLPRCPCIRPLLLSISGRCFCVPRALCACGMQVTDQARDWQMPPPPQGAARLPPPRVWLVFVFFTLFTVPSRPALAHGCPALNDSPGKEGGSSGTGRGAGRGSDSQRQPRPGLPPSSPHLAQRLLFWGELVLCAQVPSGRGVPGLASRRGAQRKGWVPEPPTGREAEGFEGAAWRSPPSAPSLPPTPAPP